MEDRAQELEGTIREILPESRAWVELDGGGCISAEISARIRVRFVSVRAGDRVRCEVSPYDPAKARITEKLSE